jgi:hypothetical protein
MLCNILKDKEGFSPGGGCFMESHAKNRFVFGRPFLRRLSGWLHHRALDRAFAVRRRTAVDFRRG